MIWAATWQNQQNECASSEDSDQPGHPPSLIRVFAVRMKKPWGLSYPLSAQRRLWSDWADVFTGRTLILLVLSCRGSYSRKVWQTSTKTHRLWLMTRHKRLTVLKQYKRITRNSIWLYLLLKQGVYGFELIILQKWRKQSCFFTHLCLATQANSEDPVRTPQNVSSDQGLHYMLPWISIKLK